MSSVGTAITGSQYAALPWRWSEDHLEILLVTTLSTRRWVVPKGWPIEGRTPSECAAQEAFEEAGVVGATAPRPVGSFSYLKRRKSGETVPCRVAVFPLEVEQQRRTWPEKAVRETCWCSVDEALVRVTEQGLKRLIARFAKEQADQPH
jgi:8-oxo-dGTP pyrophosphatase MutT (NUDIX family)